MIMLVLKSINSLSRLAVTGVVYILSMVFRGAIDRFLRVRHTRSPSSSSSIFLLLALITRRRLFGALATVFFPSVPPSLPTGANTERSGSAGA